jgi:hypothetical protein
VHSTYFTQTCSHEAQTGTGGDARPTYAAPATLACFRIDRNQLVRDRTGAQVVSTTEIRTGVQIGLDDQIDGRTVIATGVGRGLFGAVDFYKAYLA